jgi:Adenosine-deaminase (editase) domain
VYPIGVTDDGAQGALLSTFFSKPLYISSVTVATLPEQAVGGAGVHSTKMSVSRALQQRISEALAARLEAPYRHNQPTVFVVPASSALLELGLTSTPARTSPSGGTTVTLLRLSPCLCAVGMVLAECGRCGPNLLGDGCVTHYT